MSAVTNSAYQAYNFAREYVPTLVSPQNILKNVQRVAFPAIALATLVNLPGADAGPWAACICIAACLPLAEAPPLFAACLAVCGVALAAPTP